MWDGVTYLHEFDTWSSRQKPKEQVAPRCSADTHKGIPRKLDCEPSRAYIEGSVSG